MFNIRNNKTLLLQYKKRKIPNSNVILIENGSTVDKICENTLDRLFPFYFFLFFFRYLLVITQ
jgi:hypothetical protein